MPGVLLLADVLEAVRADPALAAMVGSAPRLGIAKFLGPVGPGTALAVRFEATPAALRFEIDAEGTGSPPAAIRVLRAAPTRERSAKPRPAAA